MKYCDQRCLYFFSILNQEGYIDTKYITTDSVLSGYVKSFFDDVLLASMTLLSKVSNGINIYIFHNQYKQQDEFINLI